jgi:drug/metabolite transporter (DMT)-like permease
MPAALLITGAAFLFAVMGLCVKLASAQYSAGEIVFYRALVGMLLMGAILRARGGTLRTAVPGMHFWRALSGVAALCLWFYAIGGLPLATAMTLNYMSSVWMALFLLGGAVLMGSQRVDGRLVAAVLAGFVGVALVLRPTIDERAVWHGLAGLASGMLSAMAYLQVTALGRAGEPEARIVFYFSLGGVIAGAAITALGGGPSAHTPVGVALLLAIGVLASAAQLMMTRAYAIGSALSNATLQYTGIAWSFVFGVLVFGDPVHAMALAGMALIVGAGIAATWLGLRAKAMAAPADSQL